MDNHLAFSNSELNELSFSVAWQITEIETILSTLSDSELQAWRIRLDVLNSIKIKISDAFISSFIANQYLIDSGVLMFDHED